MYESILNLKEDFATQVVMMLSEKWNISTNLVLALLLVVIAWSLVWKFKGMWLSARQGSMAWFLILGLTNTLGILPIIYLYRFSKKKTVARKIARKSVKKKVAKKNSAKKKRR